MRKRVIIVFVVLLVMPLVLPAMGQVTKTSVIPGNPIKIGGALPLTGIYSESAKWIKAGYEYWAEDVNKGGGLLGRPVKMIIYDDESSMEKAVTYYERAITVDKVDLLFGDYPGTANVALMPLVEKYEKVFVGMGGHLKSFEQGYSYSFASPPLMGEWSPISLVGVVDDLIPKADLPKSIAVLTANNVMGLSARGIMIKAMEERGIQAVVDETYNLPLSDAAPLVAKAKARGAEVLACLSFFDDTVMIMRSAKATRYNPKLIWNMFASRIPAWAKELGEDGDHVVAPAIWQHTLPYPGNQTIIEGAKTKLGIPVPPDFFGLGYCWMYTLQLAVQGAGSLDNTKIRDCLRSHTFDLPYGRGVKFDSRGLPSPYDFALQTRGGRSEVIWPKDVAVAKIVYPKPSWSK